MEEAVGEYAGRRLAGWMSPGLRIERGVLGAVRVGAGAGRSLADVETEADVGVDLGMAVRGVEVGLERIVGAGVGIGCE